jgi:hypothetical protein
LNGSSVGFDIQTNGQVNKTVRQYMSTLHYHSGEAVMKGDRVRLAADEGRVIHIGGELKEWGLSEQDREGKVMIECGSMALVCAFADSEDLIFVSHADANPK